MSCFRNYCSYFNGLILILLMDLNVCSEETDGLPKQSVVPAPEAVESPETVVAAEEVHQVPMVTASKPKYRYGYTCLSVPFVWYIDKRVTLFCIYILSSLLSRLPRRLYMFAISVIH